MKEIELNVYLEDKNLLQTIYDSFENKHCFLKWQYAEDEIVYNHFIE